MDKDQANTIIDILTKQQEQFGQAIMSETKKTRLHANYRIAAILLVSALFVTVNLLGARSLFGQSGYNNIPDDEQYIALVKIEGSIEPGAHASASVVTEALELAYADEDAKGVIILINSPGGTPVQATIIHDNIIALSKRYDKQTVVVAEDMLTSGAYLVASAAPKIFVNGSTLTGSIGVIQQSYGYGKLAKKLGIEQRSFFSGEYKLRLDPFAPVKAEDADKMQVILTKMHEQFIEIILKSRKGRLKTDTVDLFTGDFWTGTEAVALGLADGLGDLNSVMKQEFDVEWALDFSKKRGILDGLSDVFARSLVESIEVSLNKVMNYSNIPTPLASF